MRPLLARASRWAAPSPSEADEPRARSVLPATTAAHRRRAPFIDVDRWGARQRSHVTRRSSAATTPRTEQRPAGVTALLLHPDVDGPRAPFALSDHEADPFPFPQRDRIGQGW